MRMGIEENAKKRKGEKWKMVLVAMVGVVGFEGLRLDFTWRIRL